MARKKFTNPIVSVVTEALKTIVDFISLSDRTEEALSIGQIYQQMWAAVKEEHGWDYWPVNIYLESDGSALFGVFSSDGKLFKASLDVKDNETTVGEMVEVTMEFVAKETNEESIRVFRQKDGRYRFVVITGTTVVNKAGYIDSTQFFRKMFDRAAKYGKYPFATFYHLDEQYQVGQVDWLELSENVAIASGLFDETEMGTLMRKAVERESEYWGISNSFYVLGEPDVMEVSEIQIPILNDGKYYEISFLPKKIACSWFTATSVHKEAVMDEIMEEAILKLVDGDKKAAKEFIAEVDSINRKIEDEDLIHRSKDVPSKEKTEEAGEVEEEVGDEESTENEESAETGDEEANIIELDQAAVDAIGESVVGGKVIQEFIEEIHNVVEIFGQRLDAGLKEVTQVKVTISELAKEDEEKQKKWTKDLPQKQRSRVTFRPRSRPLPEDGDGDGDDKEEVSMTDIAEETLADIA